MDPQLQELVRTTRSDIITRDASPYSFVTYYGPNSSFKVKSNKLTEFWQGYCQVINRDVGNYCIGEKLPDNFPVLARFNLKFHHSGGGDEEEEKALYPKSFLLCLVQCFQQGILDTLEVEYTQGQLCEKLICVIQESEVPWKETTPGGDWIIVQIQIQFPYCKDDLNHQMRILRPKVIEHFRRNNIMTHLPQQPAGDWDTIMIPLAPGDSIPLYRSTTRPEIPKLSLNYIVGPIEQKHVDTIDIPSIGLGEVFQPDRHEHVEKDVVKSSMFAEDVDLSHWIPLFTSMNYCSQITSHRELEEPLRPATVRPSPVLRTQNGEDIATENDMQKAERFLHMMRGNPSRVKEEHYWRDIGKALYRCSKGGEDGLQAWMSFTERQGRDPDECRILYYTPDFQNSRLTIKTLAWFAREDAPPLDSDQSRSEYKEWHKQWCLPWMLKATSCKHAEVSEAFYRFYWLDYLNSNVSRSGWYTFQDNIWKPSVQGVDLSKKIYMQFANFFSQLAREAHARFENSEDENERD